MMVGNSETRFCQPGLGTPTSKYQAFVDQVLSSKSRLLPGIDKGILDAGGQLAQGQQTASQHRADSIGSNRHAVKSVDVEIGVACNSSSMGFAFLHGGMRLPECVLLRQGSEASRNRTSYDTFCCFGSQHSWDVSV